MPYICPGCVYWDYGWQGRHPAQACPLCRDRAWREYDARKAISKGKDDRESRVCRHLEIAKENINGE